MRFLFASDSFKGTLSSEQTADLLGTAAREIFGESAEFSCIPMADGGEGTADALVKATGGEFIRCMVHDPLGRPIQAEYGRTGSSDAVIEMAAASGLTLLKPEERNPMETSTFGTGELILDALDRGFGNIYITLGGSATNDGGMGCLEALGARFIDGDGRELKGCGANLAKVSYIDKSGMDSRLAGTRFIVLCDVDIPLTGPNGTSLNYGEQKGASRQMQQELERGMCNYRDCIRREFGTDPYDVPGTGAAGGLGAALLIGLGGDLESGIETVLRMSGFDAAASVCDYVITGEGRTDAQSCHGKVLSGIGSHCMKTGVPAIALSGSVGSGGEEILNHGISRIFTVTGPHCTPEESMADAAGCYLRAAREMFKALKK